MSQNVKPVVKFAFVGATGKSNKKIDWPLRIVAKSIRMYLDGAGSAQAIFQSLLPEMNELLQEQGKAPVELPPSYTNKHAASVHYGMRERFLAKLAKKNEEALALAEEFGLEFQAVEVPADAVAE